MYEVTPRGARRSSNWRSAATRLTSLDCEPGQATLENRRPAADGAAAKVVHRHEAATASGAGSGRVGGRRRAAANYRPGRQRRELRRGIDANRLPRRRNIRSRNDVLNEQLGRLGGTVYELRNLAARIDGQPMVPLSVLGKLRHEMVRN